MDIKIDGLSPPKSCFQVYWIKSKQKNYRSFNMVPYQRPLGKLTLK